VGTAPRGFALYVGLDELKAAADGVSLSTIVTALRQTLAELAPHAESYATVALAPASAGGRDVDVVRLALHEPSAVARTKTEEPDQDHVPGGVTIDISRRRVHIDGEGAALTFKEFELLQYLVLREGRTIERTELVASLWSHADDGEAPASARSTCTCGASAPSSAATRTSCAPCAESATGSTGTPTSSSASATARPRPTASEAHGDAASSRETTHSQRTDAIRADHSAARSGGAVRTSRTVTA
jgi:hypothetical protein